MSEATKDLMLKFLLEELERLKAEHLELTLKIGDLQKKSPSNYAKPLALSQIQATAPIQSLTNNHNNNPDTQAKISTAIDYALLLAKQDPRWR